MLDIQQIKSSQLADLHDPMQHKVLTVMPATRARMARQAAETMARRTDQQGLLLIAEDDLRLGFIMTANLVYAKTRSDFFAYAAQDAFPGHYWLDYGLDSLRRTGAGLLAFNEGRFFGKIAAFGLAARDWLSSLYGNFIFHPGYASHFADVELSVLALHQGRLAFNPNALLMEVDFAKHDHPNNPADEALYIKRAASGFDGRMPPFVPEKP